MVFPCRLMCCQDTTEPFAIARISISRSFAARGAVQSCSGAEDAIYNVRGLTPHASRVNGIASVVMIPVAFYVPLLEEPQDGLESSWTEDPAFS